MGPALLVLAGLVALGLIPALRLPGRHAAPADGRGHDTAPVPPAPRTGPEHTRAGRYRAP